MIAALEKLTVGMPIVFGGDKLAFVSAELAARFAAGDRLIVVQEDGALLHVPASVAAAAARAVGAAQEAFSALAKVSDAAITGFFRHFAAALEDGGVWADIAEANAADVRSAAARGRSTGRLTADGAMRAGMVAGLRAWAYAPATRERVVATHAHQGWGIEQVTAPLGVVGFVFEGRPNVFADAAGIIRGGNTAVFRIGADALATARAISERALRPALAAAGLPAGSAVLLDCPDRAAGWALFADPRLSLAVARGSGPAVAQLGAVARQSGVPVSLHGTGGAWLVADRTADAHRFAAAVEASLDRKVCNTLGVCCIVGARADDLVPAFVQAVGRAGQVRGAGAIIHAVGDALAETAAQGLAVEPLALSELGREWEWDDRPEVSLVTVEHLEAAIALFNRWSPRFAASLIAEDADAQARFYEAIDAPFVGDGFTRWVDGQYAFDRPELGLSNWQGGRLFARGAILSGDGVFTLRTRMRQQVPELRR